MKMNFLHFIRLLIFLLFFPFSAATAVEGKNSRPNVAERNDTAVEREKPNSILTDTAPAPPSSLLSLLQKTQDQPSLDLRATTLGQAVQKGNIHAYRIEMEKLLNDSTVTFIKEVNAVTSHGVSIFPLMELIGKQRENTNFHKEALSLYIALHPPLGKKNKEGMKALDIAQAEGNTDVDKVLFKYHKIVSNFELNSEKDNLWSQNLTLVDLEKTPLAQAILKEDSQAFYKEIEKLLLSPAKELLSLLHSQTKEGEGLFHLTARVKSRQKDFAQGIEMIINFILPPITKEVVLSDNVSEAWKVYKIGFGLGASIFGPLAVWEFLSAGRLFEGIIMGGLTAVGIGICHQAFKQINKTESENKSN